MYRNRFVHCSVVFLSVSLSFSICLFSNSLIFHWVLITAVIANSLLCRHTLALCLAPANPPGNREREIESVVGAGGRDMER